MTQDPTPRTDKPTTDDNVVHTAERAHLEVFEALGTVVETETGVEGFDWSERVAPEDWKEHEERLRSVIDAEQEAELLGSDVLIG